jgi:hypothetical protein
MVNRLLLLAFFLTALVLAVTPTATVAADPVLMQDFDRNACYAKCPCSTGTPGQVDLCFECKQECERKYWKSFDKEMNRQEK